MIDLNSIDLEFDTYDDEEESEENDDDYWAGIGNGR
jgi:hypothetical protein